MTTAFNSSAGKAAAYGSRRETTALYVSFRVDSHLMGVPVHVVQEVLNPHTIAPTPRARPEIAGLLNLRGQIVTAVDLRCRLGIQPGADQATSMNVVVRHREESCSLLVDEVGDVIDVAGMALVPPPPTLKQSWRQVITGVIPLEDELMIVLDVAAILVLDKVPGRP